MGFLSAAKGIIGIGGNADKVVETGLNLAEMGAKGIDALWHTEEEKAEDAKEAKKNWFAHVVKMNELFNKSNTASSKARRTLAFIITVFVLIDAGYCSYIISRGYFSDSIELDRAKLLVKDLVSIADAFNLGWAFTAVVATFFISHGYNKAKGQA